MRPIEPCGQRARAVRGRPAGWSLTELLTVLAMVLVLATLAIPNYQQQQRVARRSDARSALQQVLLDQARYRSQHDSFATQLSALGWADAQSPQGHYQLQIVHADDEGYSAEATPQGTQAQDRGCNPMRLRWQDSASLTYSSGASSDSDLARCWNL